MRNIVLILSALALGRPLFAVTTVMTPWSGSDGPFNIISMDGNTLYQGADQGGGNYAGFMYFRRPVPVTFPMGSTLYVEVDYKDIGGPGKMGIQYNAVGNAFATSGFVLNSSVYNTGGYKTAVMRLDNSYFQYLQNGGNDVRLTHTQNLRFHVKEMRISDTPGAAYLAATAFMGPYTGPAYNQGTPVDATTFNNKLVCGYQGWFRTPGDDDDIGWQHWTGSWGNLNPSLISEDFWPDMTEYLAGEKFAAPGFTYPGPAQAHLFSSDNYRTVLRHFQWMEAHGIDGAALQRFTNWGSGGPGIDSFRVIAHVREAANRTGRVWFVEYDMTGTNEADIVPAITADWRNLVDNMKVDEDDRYLHDGGRPVVAIHGFYRERFSVATANAIVDIFQGGGAYDAYLLASGEWYWDQQMPSVPAWNAVIYRMDAWLGWNAGNLVNNPPMAKTDYWNNNRSLLAAQGVKFVPELFPGASSYHRDGQEIPALPSAQFCPRRGGDFYWEQFATVRNLNFTTVFLGMFDEYDEGTQIAKALPVASAPAQRSWLDYEGQPSDCYLCYTGQGARMMKGLIPYQATKPNCPGMTQPSIPENISPTENSSVAGPGVTLTWGQSYPAAGSSAAVTLYELDVDGVLSTTTSLSDLRSLANGGHTWRVRARNSLGNYSGWSLKLPFTVTGSPLTPTRTRTASPSPTRSPTRSPTPSASPTRTPVPLAGCSIQAEDYVAYSDLTVGNTGGAYRSDDVDIEACGDAGGGFNVGWTDNGEWLEYDVFIPSAGLWDLGVRTASNNATGGQVQLSLDGAPLGPATNLPNTTGWQTYQTTVIPGLSLPAGLHRLRLTLVFGGSNLNYLCANPAATPTATPTRTRSSTATPTPTRSSSPSASSSPTRSASPSPTATASASGTPTWTSTLSRTPSPSRSATPSLTQTHTMTATRSATAPASPSATPTATGTRTGSLSATQSSSATRSATVSPTLTSSASGTLTLSSTLSRTPTPSRSATPSLTRTHTLTATRSATDPASPSATPTATATRSSSPSATQSPSPSRTSSPSPTMTASASATLTWTSTLSRTPSASRSATPSLTLSHTVSATRSATPIASPSSSPTSSGTSSSSPSATQSPSATRSSSPSPTATASASSTLTWTATLSRTPTPSRSASPSLTLSPTPTASASGTLTWTATLSRTLSHTVSATRSATPLASPTPSHTISLTLSASPSLTQSPSATASVSASSSASPTPSATLTATASLSSTSTATPTQTALPIWTPTLSRTPSPTPTASASGTLTWTASLSRTPSRTLTRTPSLTASGSPTPAATASSTATPSGTLGASATRSPTPTASASPSPTLQATGSATHSATRTPSPTVQPSQAPSPSPAKILAALAAPNPNPTEIRVQLQGGPAILRLAIYTSSHRLAEVAESGPWGPGWVGLALPPAFLSQAGNGTYYFVVRVLDSHSKAVGKFTILK